MVFMSQARADLLVLCFKLCAVCCASGDGLMEEEML